MGPLRTFKSCKVSSAIRPLLGTASLIAVLGTLFVGAAAAKKLLGMESKERLGDAISIFVTAFAISSSLERRNLR